jgi:hypothetical protein
MDARTKAVKTHRKRLRTRGMKRVEVTLQEQDAALLRRVASKLRKADAEAARIRSALREAIAAHRAPTLAEALYDPVISGPEFDEVFDEIERARRDPVMLKVRDVDL